MSCVPNAFQVCSFHWQTVSSMKGVVYTLALLWIVPKRSADKDRATTEEETEK